MNYTLADIVGDFFHRLAEIGGLSRSYTWDKAQVQIRSYKNIPSWASDTLISLLGNMPENEGGRPYLYIRRRLKRWDRIPAGKWAKSKTKLTAEFLEKASKNLREILSYRQAQLPWIISVVETYELVRNLIADNKYCEAEKLVGWLKHFRAEQASLLNPELANAVESLARATVAAAEQEVEVVAINSMKDGLVDLRNHPIGILILHIDRLI